MKIFFKVILLLNFFNLSSQTIPPDIKKIVGFIYTKLDDNSFRAEGTGFFVGLTNPKDSTKTVVHLVTAKHVLKSNDSLYDEIYVRLNTKDDKSQYAQLKLVQNGANKNVFFHNDEGVDIAVIPVFPDTKVFDFLYLPSQILSNKKVFQNLKIAEGSDVFFTGLFTPFTGNKKIYPIVRFGRVALLTEEKIPWDDEMLNLYLIESSSYGGNSGSPVFFYLGADRGDGSLYVGTPQLKLAGIMKGYFGEKAPLLTMETKVIPASHRNIGIAAVVPSYYLEEIIFSNELKEIRGF